MEVQVLTTESARCAFIYGERWLTGWLVEESGIGATAKDAP